MRERNLGEKIIFLFLFYTLTSEKIFIGDIIGKCMTIQLESQVDAVSRTGFENPFYVVVHSKDFIPKFPLDIDRANRVLSEIDFIRTFEDENYVELDQQTPPETILSGIPMDRPILVCGFFGDICVKQQRDALRRTGYDNSHICSEATYF